MTRRSTSRGILYSAPPTTNSEESESADEATAETEKSAGEAAAADD